MIRHTQTVTLQVDFDIAKLPPPEQWPWNDAAAGAYHTTVLAAGPVQKIEPPLGFALAMEVLQSNGFAALSTEAKEEVRALAGQGQLVV